MQLCVEGVSIMFSGFVVVVVPLEIPFNSSLTWIIKISGHIVEMYLSKF